MPNRRWAGAAPTDGEEARQRLLNAAESCFRRHGLSKTTLEDIASAANVSRQTVYNHFPGGREELLEAVFLRDVQGQIDRALAIMRESSTFADGVVTAITFSVMDTRRAIAEQSPLGLLFTPDAAGITTSLAGASAVYFDRSRDNFRPFLERARDAGELRDGLDPDAIIEYLMRMTLSFLSTASRETLREEAEIRAFLETFLLPSLVNDPPPPRHPARTTTAGSGRRARRSRG
jgi:AcrR family transcriptional regulator